MLRQVARKTHQRFGQLGPLARHPRGRIQAAGGERAQHFLLAVPPLVRPRHGVDDAVVHAERAPGIAQHAARPVRDDHGGQGGALAAVFLVDVLDDFLAPLVFDVDIGRFVALLADEALEQRVAARGIDRGDAQAITDRRVGRRAAALAQDALRAGVADDVVDREEIGLVAQFVDQGELFFDLGGDRRRHALGKALPGAQVSLLVQVGGGRMAGGHDFVGVFVLQLVQREGAASCDGQRLGQGLGRIEAGQAQARTQVAFGVGGQVIAALADAAPGADGRQRVVQGLARTAVHLRLAQCDDGQAAGVGGVLDGGAVQVVAAMVQQGQADPGAAGALRG